MELVRFDETGCREDLEAASGVHELELPIRRGSRTFEDEGPALQQRVPFGQTYTAPPRS